MPLPRPLRRFRRRTLARAGWALAAVVTIGAIGVNGLHNIGTAQAGSTDQCRPAAASAQPQPPVLPAVVSAELEAPRSLTGPTTAITQSGAIPPITDAAASVQMLPATVVSSDGVETTVTDTTRILALNQNGGLAAAVVGLGLGCQLIGRDIATDIPSLMPGSAQLPPVTENGHELNAEAILELAPDVVITDTSIGPYDVQLQLRQAGIPVVMVPLAMEAGVEGVGPQIEFVAQALGIPALGKALAERTEAEITDVETKLAAMAPAEVADQPRTVFLYLRGSVYHWFGEGSGADSLIRSLGARDVAAEVGFAGMAPTNAEALVRAAPDVIIVMTLGLESVGGLDGALQLPGIAQTPAGSNRRIIDMSDYEVMSFGPRTAYVLAALGLALYAPQLILPSATPASGASGPG